MLDGLESAVARPKATFDKRDLYPSVHHKAAALMCSLANNSGLVDGNKRISLASVIVFYALNGYRLSFDNDEAYEFTQAVAISLRDIDAIARVLGVAVRSRRRESTRPERLDESTAKRGRASGDSGTQQSFAVLYAQKMRGHRLFSGAVSAALRGRTSSLGRGKRARECAAQPAGG